MQKELLLLLLVLGIGGLVSYKWLARGPVTVHAPQAAEVAVKKTSVAHGKSGSGSSGADRKEKAGDRKGGDRKTTAGLPASGSDIPVFPPAIMTVTIPDAPFPTPESLKIGSSRAELRAAFGEPAMDIAGIRDGRVLERYYYLNRERSLLTVATVENGKVTAAESLSNPYFQIPRTK
jgi:hypothetical protein